MQFSCIWVCLRKSHLHQSDLLVTHTSGPHSCSLALAVSIKYVDLDWNDKCFTADFFSVANSPMLADPLGLQTILSAWNIFSKLPRLLILNDSKLQTFTLEAQNSIT